LQTMLNESSVYFELLNLTTTIWIYCNTNNRGRRSFR
jgi:hypothetical protein